MGDPHLASRDAGEIGVVADHRDAVGRAVHVGLDVRDAGVHGVQKREQGVLGRVQRESAVGEDARGAGEK
ncbi:hypothetical protein GCM10025869_32170 [Homoserinibacter gongjuensis]|uniref:Uncharacterized protein n=1 Tax=Homoserinibacter gongjuensis TaxID=1162968 RepID=A0ABQ6JZ90_9MICO|nr:hypothetical protein GCM10025869_32170 [Homoserinibacter gongjuensis]